MLQPSVGGDEEMPWASWSVLYLPVGGNAKMLDSFDTTMW